MDRGQAPHEMPPVLISLKPRRAPSLTLGALGETLPAFSSFSPWLILAQIITHPTMLTLWDGLRATAQPGAVGTFGFLLCCT